MTVGEHHALTSGVYCPRLVREWITEESSPELRHRSIEGSMVFADVSGFTKMSERLARFGRLGAESVTDVIGACFSRLLAEAYAYAGTLLQFGGDALLLFYRGEDHAARAASAALEMRRALRSMRGFRTEAGLVSLSMTVGVNSGHFDFFLVGDSHRQLVVGGQAASHLVELEGAADKGRILIGAATAAALPRANVGPGRGPGQLLRGHPPASRRDGVEFLVTGHDLSGFVPVGLRRAVAVDAVESEHRTATVAFVHFDGLDRAIEQDGADVAAERLHDLMAGVQRAIDDRGICFQSADIGVDGGKFYLSVGAPLGTGSDEEHMLLALREIVELEVGFPLRAGVNRGPVFTGEIGTVHRRTYTTMGDTVNLAARLMGKAPMGQVLATRAVLDRSQTLFETAELPPLMVKGKRHPVTAFAVGPPTGVRTPMTGDGLPLVGRERELAAFRSAVDDAAAGTGRLIEVVAEPGAGKSRLLEQFVADAGGLEVHQVSCRLYQAATPYFVFEELLGEVFDLRDRAGRTAVEHLRSLVRENDPTLEPWLSLLAVPFGLEIPPSEAVRQLDEEFRKQQLQTVVTRFLDRALARPLLLCIENTHWMDDASGDLLDAVLADLTDRPWLVVLTRRDGDGGYEPAARAPDERLALGPLGSAALEELVDAVAADTPLAPHVRDDLVRRCDGNPLFLLELLQAVLAGEDVHELPTSVEGLITARIDRLPADDRALLRQVSVLGAGFRAAYATSVAPPGLRTSVDDALRQLTDFLSVDPSGWVGFRHHLVRDVAYAGLPFRNRRELHGRVADSLLRRVGDQVEEEAPLLSLHCAAAHRHADAWRYSVMAGDQAHEVFANLDATRFYERALDAARHLPDLTPLERAATLEKLGDVQDLAGLCDDARRSYATARRLLADLPERQAQLDLKTGFVDERLGRFTRAIRNVRTGQRRLQGRDGPDVARLRARLAVWYAVVRVGQGRFAEAAAAAAVGARLAGDAGDEATLAQAEIAAAYAESAMGRSDGVAAATRALEISTRLGDLRGEATAANMLGTFAYYGGRWDEAADHYRRSRAARERMGDTANAAVAAANLAELLVEQGHVEEAEADLRDAEAVWRTTGDEWGLAFSRRLRGIARARIGDTQQAAALLAAARDAFDTMGARAEVVASDVCVAELRLLSGDVRGAVALLDELATVGLADLGCHHLEPTVHRLRGLALASDGTGHEPATAELELALRLARARDAWHEVALALHALVADDRRHGRAVPTERSTELQEITRRLRMHRRLAG